MKAFIRIVSAASRVGGFVAIILVATAAVIVSEMVFLRYVMNASTIWQTEFVTYALVAATFLGSPYVLLEKGHVNIDILQKLSGPRLRLGLEIASGVIGLTFCLLFAWSGWHHFYEAWANNWTTDTVWAPTLWILLLPIPAGIGLLCLQYVAEILKLGEDRP